MKMAELLPLKMYCCKDCFKLMRQNNPVHVWASTKQTFTALYCLVICFSPTFKVNEFTFREGNCTSFVFASLLNWNQLSAEKSKFFPLRVVPFWKGIVKQEVIKVVFLGENGGEILKCAHRPEGQINIFIPVSAVDKKG